jgi:hypothetical protein
MDEEFAEELYNEENEDEQSDGSGAEVAVAKVRGVLALL